METLELLKRARELIARPNGWIKGEFVTSSGDGVLSYCAIGALEAAVADPWSVSREADPNGSRQVAEEVLNRHVPQICAPWILQRLLQGLTTQLDIVQFNDHPSTTQADVVALFDRAIASLEAIDTAETVAIYLSSRDEVEEEARDAEVLVSV